MSYHLLLIIIPFFLCIINGFGAHLWGQKGGKALTFLGWIFNLWLTFWIWKEFLQNEEIFIYRISNWILCDNLQIDAIFTFDILTLTMIFLVNIISFLVHIYSFEYMKIDPHLNRFLSYISLFTFFMLLLITSGTWLQLFFGWEGVGLASFLLIGFWHTKIQANKSAIKAMILNKIGDLFLTISLILIFSIMQTTSFNVFLALPIYFENLNISLFGFSILNIIGFLIVIGCMGKSAQIFLHTWLPDAMEGPTPISALIHAATMVTAGIFLLIKCAPFLETTPNVLLFITFIGALTALITGSIALFQYDIKKIIAYSTCSQLGFMFFSVGMSGYVLSLFHLINHGFFKALLFLSAGSILHALSNEQDIRKMGGLLQIFPITYMAFIIGLLSLVGFPFLSGFFSKEIILEYSRSFFTINSYVIENFSFFATFLTIAYSIRLIFFVFFFQNKSHKPIILKSHESSSIILFVLIFLTFGSIFFGYFTNYFFLSFGQYWFQDIINLSLNKITSLNLAYNQIIHDEINFLNKYLPIFSLILIFSLLYTFYYIILPLNLIFSHIQKLKTYNYIKTILKWPYILWIFNIFRFFNKKWFFDNIYNKFFGYIWWYLFNLKILSINLIMKLNIWKYCLIFTKNSEIILQKNFLGILWYTFLLISFLVFFFI